MSAAAWKKTKRLLGDALELPTDERSAWLAEACGSDHELRRAVESLLGVDESAVDFLEQPALGEGVEALAEVTRGDLPGQLPSALPTPERVGPYRLEARLGSGGMGTVWRAWDERLRRPVAVKHVRRRLVDEPHHRERFLREARAAAWLNHPALVHIYGFLETPEGDWIVMELIEGMTLGQRIRESAPLAVSQILRWSQAIARGLAEAHAREIVHRDLKSENVMITDKDQVKILDFGLAKIAGPAGRKGDPLTGEGQIVGTARAMSPEQVRGLAVDARSDLFSLGTLLYEMITGESPFSTPTRLATLLRVCHHDPPPVVDLRPEAPAALSELVRQLMAKEPADRPANARQVLTALIAISRTWRELEGASPGSKASTSPPSRRSVPEPKSRGGERRQVTILLCDLVGVEVDAPTEAAPSALDLEVLSELMPDFQGSFERLLERYGGTFGHGAGHRLWGYFGYPRAHEDSAQRAVHVALELADELMRWAEPAARFGLRSLALRAAVHSGPGIVTSQLALGPTLEQAIALHDQVAARQIWVSEPVHRLLAGTVASEVVPPIRRPGAGGPLPVFRVLGWHDASPTGAGAAKGFFGREEELAALLDRWRRVHDGRGQTVVVVGEAGIGKSRLVRALAERIDGEAGCWWVARAVPYHRHSPLYPVAELVQRLTDPGGDASPAQSLERLEATLDRPGLRREELHALAAWFLERAAGRPAVLVVEDVHWADPSTLEFLELLARQARSVPLLLLVTSRSGRELSLAPSAEVLHITLEALAAEQAAALVEGVTAVHPLPAAVREEIVAQGDGVPLFLEELARSWIDAEGVAVSDPGEGSHPHRAVPSTLKDLLTARIDQLGAIKILVQEAAVLGREFSEELLIAVSTCPVEELRRGVDRLSTEGILAPRPGEDRRFEFRHALLRDAAYESMLEKTRRQIHRRVAEQLEDRFSAWESRQPELLAHHLTAAGDGAAPGAWLRAGRRALDRAEPREAIRHLECGLALLTSASGSGVGDAELARLELALLTSLGAARSLTRGYGSSEVEGIYRRAWQLRLEAGAAQSSVVLEDFRTLWGLGSFHLARGELDRALELGEQLLDIAGSASPEPERELQQMLALSALGQVRYYRGETAAARVSLAQAVELDPPGRAHARTSMTGQDAGVIARAALALALWHQGEDTAAVAASDAAIALAERLGHAYSRTLAEVSAAQLHQSRGDVERLSRCAKAVIAHSREHGELGWSQGVFFRGCALAELRRRGLDSDSGPTENPPERFLERGLETYVASGARVSISYMLAQIAEVLLDQGRVDEAAQRLAEAEAATATGEEYWRPELHRLAGRLALERGGPEASAQAKEAFRRALELARRRGDRALARRAEVALEELLPAHRAVNGGS